MLSNTRIASKLIDLIILIGFISYIYILIKFEIYLNPITNKLICSDADSLGSYRKIFFLYNLIIFGLNPSLCMIIFGLLTLNNIYKRKKLKNKKLKKIEKELFPMLFTQIIVYSLSCLTFSITLIYLTMK